MTRNKPTCSLIRYSRVISIKFLPLELEFKNLPRLKHKLFNLFRYEEDIEHLKRLLEQIESGLLKAQAIIDKKQSQIDLKTKEKDQLIVAKNGAALSPLEADIERTKSEIEATQNFCAAAKKTWLSTCSSRFHES